MKVSVKMNVEDNFHSIFQSLNSLISNVGELHLKPNIKVIIKPNLCALKRPETGATTDVKVVEALIRIIKREEPTARIYIVESDTHIRDTWKAFELLGFLRLREKYGVELINLTEEELVEVNIDNGHFFQKIHVPKILTGEKLLISAAKLKTHSFEKMSCALKNLFGLLPEKNKHVYHPYLNKVLFDVMRLFNPTLNVIDGIYVMESGGPIKGEARKARVLVVGDNVIATDIIAAKLMGFNPLDVPYLEYAIKHLGVNMEEVEVYGDGVRSLNFKFIPKTSFLVKRFIEKHPEFRPLYKWFRRNIRRLRRVLGV